MDISTNLLEVNFDSCIINAAGPNNSTFKELELIGKSDSSAIMMKSCTLEQRKGNEEPRYARLSLGAIQCMGLPNLGYKKYIEFAPKLKKYNKPIIASISGLCVENYVKMVKAFQDSEVDLIEVNLSCPNIEGKSLVGYDPEQTENILNKISFLGKKPLGLKLPAYLNESNQKKIAELILKNNISFISTINSVGNSLIIDSEKETPLIKPRGGIGGLCGEYIKPIALGNVNGFYKLLKDKVFIFGVGGVKTGKDVFEFLLAGADAVQVATTFEKENFNCFRRLNQELKEIMIKKQYKTISEIKGNLKLLS
jgi:dihydroorotate dehydrogenase (fumarate)